MNSFLNNQIDFKFSSKIINLISNLNISILRWDWPSSSSSSSSSPSTHIVQVHSSTSSWNKRCWRFLYICSIVHSIFEFVQFYLHFSTYTSNNAIDDYLLHAIWLTGIMLGSSLFTHTILYQDEIPSVMNQLFKLNAQLASIFNHSHAHDQTYKKVINKMEIFLVCYFFNCVGAWFILIQLNILYPNKARYFTSLLPCVATKSNYENGSSCTFLCNILIIIVAMLETFVVSLVWSLGCIQFFLNLTYIESTLASLQLLLKSKNSLPITQQTHIYQSIHVLNQTYNQSFGFFLYPLVKLTFGSVSVCSIYATIQLSHSSYNGNGKYLVLGISIIISIVSLFMQMFLYPRAGQMRDLSCRIGFYDFNVVCNNSNNSSRRSSKYYYAKILDSISNNNRRSHFTSSNNNEYLMDNVYKRVSYKAFSPISLRVGIFYEMKTITYFTFLHQVFQFTLPLLML